MSKSEKEPAGSAEQDGPGGKNGGGVESSTESGRLSDQDFGGRVVPADAEDGSGRVEFAGGHDVVAGTDGVSVGQDDGECERSMAEREPPGTSGGGGAPRGGGTSGGEVMTWRPARGPVTRVVAGLVLLMVLTGIGIMLYWSVLMFQGRPVPFLERLFPPVVSEAEEAEQIEEAGDGSPGG